MLKNYLIIAFRNLSKHKLYAFVNIAGLSVGIAFFTLLFLLVWHEISFDTFHSKGDRIYRTIAYLERNGIGERAATMPFPFGPTVKKVYPEHVENYVRIFNFQLPNHTLSINNQNYSEQKFYFVDDSFFEIFDFPLAQGSPYDALKQPNSIVISHRIAEKYFGDTDPIGKKIVYKAGNPQTPPEMTITGVFAPPKYQSHFDFDFIASFSTLTHKNNFLSSVTLQENWIRHPCWTYLLLTDDNAPENLEYLFSDFIPEYYPNFLHNYLQLYLQPLKEIYLYSDLDHELAPNGDITYIFIFSAIGLLILAITIINFTNLSTARSSIRAKEVGIRKAIGAFRTELVYQFLVEYFLISFVAIMLSLVILEIFLPFLSSITLSRFDFQQIDPIVPMGISVSTGLIIGLISSIYPSYYLSKLVPSQALNGTLAQGIRSKMFRSTLVVIQFVITIFLMISTLITFRQHDYLQNASLGFDQENIVLLPIAQTQMSQNYERVKAELLQSPHISSVTGLEDILGLSHNTHDYKLSEEGDWQFLPSQIVQQDFITTFGIEMLVGRGFQKGRGDEDSALIVNESFIKYAGWESPEAALGKRILVSDSTWHRVIGVMKDFHFESLREKMMPFIIKTVGDPRSQILFTNYIAIKINDPKALDAIENTWKAYLPDRAFEYEFLENKLSYQYQEEKKLGKVSAYFSLVAIFLACLGLFGLSSFVMEQRRKEIAIRKALGSNDGEIVLLLSREFFILAGIAILIGWSISYVIMKSWLSNFPLQVPLDFFIFLFTATIVLGITLLTVSYHTVKAALKEPVESLQT
ncbi:MAG: ABC transporter permease [Flammeovirgaceae bacterium]